VVSLNLAHPIYPLG